MRPATHVFLFGDQTYDFVPDLHKLLGCRNKPILNAFLEQSHYVIRAQMNLWLPQRERHSARTSSLANLFQKYCEGKLSPAFQVSLHCLTQLGLFISHYEEPGEVYPSQESSYLVGLCTGSLAAAAIASSSSLSELLPAAVHTVQIALRLGLLAVDMRDLIEPAENGKSQEWSALFFDIDEDVAASALSNFSKTKALPETSRPFISAKSGKALTISGSPSVLRQLQEDATFIKYKSKPIPIFVPSHCPYIFSMKDVETILSTTSAAHWSGYHKKLPIISGSSGVLVWAGGFTSFLKQALCDCLIEPIRWDKVLGNFQSLMSSSGTDSIKITPIATNLEQSMAASLNELANVSIERLNVLNVSQFQPVPQNKSKLAIVGMSGRFPGSTTPQAFWDLLYEGLDVCKEVPPERWNWKTHVTADGKGHNLGGTKWGCWLDFIDQFDARFFNISPKEAPQMDPAQRMALMITHEALEKSGFVPNTTPSSQNDRVGVFHGVTSNDYLECNTGQSIDTYFITGGNRSFIPGRINFCFEFCGPSYTNDTACSSSLAAIHLACNALWRGDCDTAVAGGTNLCINPDGHTGLDKGFFLSRTGNCKTFDDSADGYCRGEAIASVIIKRLDDALAEDDPILAVILDAKTNHSALADSMTRPHVEAQVDNMNAVLAAANVNSREVSYIEMHGTGTQVGDAVEMTSVLDVFAPNESIRTPENPLYVGSVKANIGHGEGVSGISSLCKVILMMKNDTIPPHCGIKAGSKINHKYPDLGARNVHIAYKPTPWKRGAAPRKILVNNFGAAGGNTALLLEDAPIKLTPEGVDVRSSHIIAVSGHVSVSLKKNLQLLLDYIKKEQSKGLSLSQLSWTTTARRKQHIFRASVTGSSLEEIKNELQGVIDRGDGSSRPKLKPKILFAFTGQGAAYMSMGKQLFHAFPAFRSDVKNFDRMAQSLGFPSFIHLIITNEGDIEQSLPVRVQIATISIQIALARLMKSFGTLPSAVTGHSLGMYAALNIAGVLSVVDTLFLVGKRAEFLQDCCKRGTHSMLAIKAPRSTVAGLLTGMKYDTACINSPGDTVISGENEDIAAAQSILSLKRIKAVVLKVPFAFHSAQVEQILQPFTAVATSVRFHKPTVPVLCPLTGLIVETEGVFGPQYLSKHCREPVDMVAALQSAMQKNIINDKTFTLEIGPHPLVCGMVRATLGPEMRTLPTLQRGADVWPNLTSILQSLYNAGLDLDWNAYHAPFKTAHTVLDLPTYGWDLKSYWIPYENDWCIYKPYGRLPDTNGSAIQVKALQLPPELARPQATFQSAFSSLPLIPQPETSTVHKMIEENIESSSATFIYECDMTRSDIHNLARGYIINGVPFTRLSWFADMALVVGKYAWQRFAPGRKAIIDIADVVGDKALVPHGRGHQPVRISFATQFKENAFESIKEAKIEFYSINATGKTIARHGLGMVRFEDASQFEALEVNLAKYTSRIKRLRDGIEDGEFTRYNKKSGYRMMSKVATFSPDYRLLDDIVVDEENLEATCIVNFGAISAGGTFAAHPGFVDAITQIGSFTVNTQEAMDLDVNVFVTHGWSGLQVYEELKMDRKYELYVQMVPDGPDFYRGDTIVLEGGKLIAFFKEVIVQRKPRKSSGAFTHTFNEADARSSFKIDTISHFSSHKLDSLTNGQAPPQKLNQCISDVSTKNTQHSSSGDSTEPNSPRTLVGASSPPLVLLSGDVGHQMPSQIQHSSQKLPTPDEPLSWDKEPAVGLEAHPSRKPQAAEMDKKRCSTPVNSSRDAALISKVMAIVSEESGIAQSELTDDSNFADMGIDSLCSMVIGSRLREDLFLELEADFSIYVSCPTVKQLKAFLTRLSNTTLEARVEPLANSELTPSAPGELEQSLEEHPHSLSPPVKFELQSSDSGADTAEMDKLATAPLVRCSASVTPLATPSNIPFPATSFKQKGTTAFPPDNSLVKDALMIVAEESGLMVADLTDDSNFADIGIDSLCSMVIQGRFREELNINLDADFSIFINCPSVLDLKAFLEGYKTTSQHDTEQSSDESLDTSTNTSPPDGSGCELIEKDVFACRPATSVVLQGIPKMASKTLFLLPDGSGSATSYAQIPRLKGDIAVVGLNCPYIRDPEEMNCTSADMINSFCNEIRRRQPNGPYHLGGWSVGGPFAFACSRVLAMEGEKVDSLIIIDASVPQKFGVLPVEFYQYCGRLGLFGSEVPADTLIPHFLRAMETVLKYKALPLNAAKMPKVGVLWACETVMDGANAPKIDMEHFMLQKRTDFGPDGWQGLLPGAEFKLNAVHGANHFTMMQKQHTGQLRDLIDQVMNHPPTESTDDTTGEDLSTPGSFAIRQSDILEAFGKSKMSIDQFIVDYKIDNFSGEIRSKSTDLCIALVVEAFEEMGYSLASAAAGEKLDRIRYEPQHSRLVDYLYKFLEKDARLIITKGSQLTRSAVAVPTKPSGILLQELLDCHPAWDYAFKLTHLAGKNLASVLAGKSDGLKVIFGSLEGRRLVTGLYCEHPVNKMCYNLMKDFLNRLILRLPRGRGPLKILEMGAGTGGTTLVLAPFLASLNMPIEYTFTDLAPNMVVQARRKFKAYPFMKFAVHDIEKPPAEELLHQHIVIASNAIHATHNLTKSGENIRKVLRPDGFLMMLEMTAIVPFIDIIFGLLEGWWLFDDGRTHAIAPAPLWERELQSVGFGHVDWTDGQLPENELQKVIIALASGPARKRLPKAGEAAT